MFSVIFPGQGSQFVGMAKEFYDNFEYVREFFSKADDLMNKKISKIILEGPKDDLDLTENTQPAIFLVSYSIFNVLKKEGGINLLEAKYYAGHSLGEYSALCCSNAIDFNQTINLLRYRGKAMQNATPKGMGGMIAILGVKIDDIHKMYPYPLNLEQQRHMTNSCFYICLVKFLNHTLFFPSQSLFLF